MRRATTFVLLTISSIVSPVAVADQPESPNWNYSTDLVRPFWEGTLMTDETVVH